VPHRNYFRARRTLVSTALAPEILSFAPREPDRVYHLTRVVLENETSIGTGDIRLAITGHGYVHPLRQFQAPAPDVLTPRERSVLEQVALGGTNRRIGAALFISEKTVSVHLSRVMAKLGVTSRTEAVSVAYASSRFSLRNQANRDSVVAARRILSGL